MKTALKRFLRGALIGGVFLGSATTAFGQIAGRVDASGGPLSGATVEVWDSYPGGTRLAEGTTTAGGEFAFGAIGQGTFDLRVRKNGFYPTVVRNLPHPVGNTQLELHPSPSKPGVTPNNSDFWGSETTFLGELIQRGDVLSVFDPQSVLCDVTTVTGSDGLYLIHAIGDDPLTAGDQGAQQGDVMTFYINGLAASPTGIWQLQASQRHELTGPTAVPGVTVVGPPDVGGLPDQSALVSFMVKNTGQLTQTFGFDVSVDLGWNALIVSPTNVELAPGENVQVDILVEVPIGAAGQTANLLFAASADSYGPANSGAIVRIEVNTTSVGSGGNGGLIPNQFSLAQNYPNPFNPETQIAYSIRTDGQARMEVFNLLGQSIAVLFDEFRTAGVHTVEWDGRDKGGASVPSGIYFYRLTQGAQAQTRKMVLLK